MRYKRNKPKYFSLFDKITFADKMAIITWDKCINWQSILGNCCSS